MLELTTQELYFLKSAVESATIKGTDVRFVAQVLKKIDIAFEEAVNKDQENTPEAIVNEVIGNKPKQISPPANIPKSQAEPTAGKQSKKITEPTT